MSDLVILVVAGISVGSIYALIGIGLNLTFLTSRSMNFGQGALMMLSATLAATTYAAGWPLVLSLGGAVLAAVLMALATEWLTVRPALKLAGSMGWVVSTLGMGVIIQGVVSLVFGVQALPFPDILFSAADQIDLFGTAVSLQYLAIVVLCLILVLVFEALMRGTVLGRALRGISMDADFALTLGIPVRTLVAASYGVSGLLAGLSGLLIAQTTGTVDPAFGFDLVIFGFVAAVVGGMGSTLGALLGGLATGVLEQLVGGYVSTGMQHSFAFLLLVLMLIVRPQGLFGDPEISKV